MRVRHAVHRTGYRKDMRAWLDPTAFIEAHRGAPEDDMGRANPGGTGD
ncbi:MAG TPA: hypothetical protein VGI41_01680 [Candidatus Udaeobacter sp.]